MKGRSDSAEIIFMNTTSDKIAVEQREFLRGYQKLEIRSDGEMEVTFKRFTTHNQFKFPLWQLNPSPTRLKHSQPGSIVGTVIFGVFGVGVIVGMIASKDWSIVAVLAFPLFLFLLLFWSCVWKLKTQSVNANVYHFRNGEGQIHVWFEKPNPEAFNSFCKILTERAEKAWNDRPIEPNSYSLTGELAALKRLKDSGILNDSEFERAKTKVLEQSEQRKIGFI